MRTAALLLLLCSPAGARPGPGGYEVTLAVTPPVGKPVLADSFRFKVEASLPAAWSVRPDTAAASNSEFEVLSFTRGTPAKSADRVTETFEVEAKAFTLGVTTFPALAWLVDGPGAPAGSAAKTEPFRLEILPAFETKEGEEIKDIYGPFRYFSWFLLPLLAALAGLGWYLYRRFRPGGGALFAGHPWNDARTPYQRARDRLDKLAAGPLAAQGKFKEFYTGLTAVLRFYLAEEFSLEAAQMTTSDLARELKHTGADIKTALRARELLQKADLVKFARLKPADARADAETLAELLAEFNRVVEHARAIAAAAAVSTLPAPGAPRTQFDRAAAEAARDRVGGP